MMKKHKDAKSAFDKFIIWIAVIISVVALFNSGKIVGTWTNRFVHQNRDLLE